MIPGIVAGGAMGSPDSVIPYPLPITAPFDSANLKYWFLGDWEAFQDVGKTVPCSNGSPIACWGNQGTQEDAVQNTSINRPTWHTGGINGRPYIECDGSQWFEDLLELDQSGSLTNWNDVTYAIVCEDVDVSKGDCSIFASPGQTRGGKSGFKLYSNAGVDSFQAQKQNHIHPIVDSNGPRSLLLPNIIITNKSGTGTQFPHKINDTAYNSHTHSTNVSPATANSTTQFLHGTGSETGPIIAKIYEILAWHGSGLSEANNNILFNYLNGKYDIF